MKPTAVLFSLFILQVKGLSLDEFAGAMSSLENSFGKLLNDVVSDIRNTVHCTMLAMEQVLAMSGAVSEPSDYNCYCHTDSVDDNYKLPLRTTEMDNQNDPTSKDIVHKISSSISNINQTLSNILENDGHERFNHVKRVLNHEANHFTEVSRLLRQELGKISTRLRNELEHIDSDKPSLESLWKDMKILHDAEANDRNVSEVNEISNVLNEALNVLHLNTSSKVTSDEDKIKTIMEQLEQESNNDNATYSNIDKEMAQWNEKRSNLQGYSDESPKTFKDVASKMFRNKDDILKQVEKSQAEDAENKSEKADSADMDYVYGGSSKEEHKKAIDKARSIIEDSTHTEKVLDDFFAKQGQTGVDVF
ncbi:uncharacterized protein [Epargyreus clarus]|uniref:uncharacterized protein n=1 Tax=Epargyreus clarus TaxID=520877 RepID=UPI003C2DE342